MKIHTFSSSEILYLHVHWGDPFSYDYFQPREHSHYKIYQSKRLSLCGAGNFSGKCSVDPSVYFFHYSSMQAMEFPVVFVDKFLSTRGQPCI